MKQHKTFKTKEGTLALVRCGKCGRENYRLNVLSGICTWCGINVNEEGE